MKYNVVISGVGGQGLITLGRLIGEACIIRGVDVSIAEVHGMSQRGGSVVVHVRLGEGESPIIPLGSAHHLIALELIEAGRSVVYAGKDAVFSVNDFLWPPPLARYPSREEIINGLSNLGHKVVVVDANQLSSKITGSPISSNIAMLGVALGVDKRLEELISLDAAQRAIEKYFKDPWREANIKVLQEGYRIGLQQRGQQNKTRTLI